MTPNFRVIGGGALVACEVDAAIAAIEFAPVLGRLAAKAIAVRVEHGAFAAAGHCDPRQEQGTAGRCGARKGRGGARCVVADALAAIFRAAQTRLLIAAAAAAYGARLLPISPILAPNPGPQR
jgi:hypothetical protein